MDTSELRRQVRALDIGPDDLTEPLEFTEGPTGAVVGGCIVALGTGVTEQHQRDVLQCLLLAQLAATAKADRHKDPSNWYKIYQQSLESVAWVTQRSSSMIRYQPSGTQFTITDVIMDVFRREVGSEAAPAIRDTMNAFQRDIKGTGQFLFECPSHSGGIGNFQFALVTEDEEEHNLLLLIGRFAFTAPVHVTRLAFETFDPSARFTTGFLAMTLNEQVYAGLRQAITDKLENRLDALAVKLEIDQG
jgi:hypothetical protein